MTKKKEETTTMEEIVDSAAKPEKITDEELVRLQATIRNMDRLTADVGRIEVQKFTILESMKSFQSEINEHRSSFMQKYGTDNVNIQTGVVAYPQEEDETPDPTQNIQENGEADKKN